MKEDNINDNEIRIVNRPPQEDGVRHTPTPFVAYRKGAQEWTEQTTQQQQAGFAAQAKKKRLRKRIIVCAAVIGLAGLMCLLLIGKTPPIPMEEETVVPQQQWHPLYDWLAQYDSTDIAGCAVKDTTVNDIDLHIFLPLNAKPALAIGMQCLYDTSNVLVCQAADLAADTWKIVGAFVLKGRPVAWGLSKKGYCAIINDSIIVGVSDNSPLFERATETEGYFFRQYPLVKNGEMQYSELRTQSIRRALAEARGKVFVVETTVKTGMHDFSQLLVDLGVDNAIYLIGGDAFRAYTGIEGTHEINITGDFKYKKHKNTNFIYWQKR